MQRQDQLDEQAKLINEVKRECDRRDQLIHQKELDVRDLNTQAANLKQKLEEAQKNLESNAQMITWLNKQLNEKPGLGGSLLPPTSQSKFGNKPPAPISIGVGVSSSTFKPSFSSIEQLGGGGGGASHARGNSFERSPSYRGIGITSSVMGGATTPMTPSQSSLASSMNAAQSSNVAPFVMTSSNVGKSTAAADKGGKTFSYTLPNKQVNNENVNTNLPLMSGQQPSQQQTFVSKYTQQIMMSHQHDDHKQQLAPITASSLQALNYQNINNRGMSPTASSITTSQYTSQGSAMMLKRVPSQTSVNSSVTSLSVY